MNRYIILITGLFILFGSRLTGQPDTALSIEQCRQWAVEHHPLYQQYGLLDQSNDLKIKNLNKNHLPELNIYGQASYQSDVTKVPTIIPSFSPKPISKDWYKLYLDVNQVIWDGGATKDNKVVQETDNLIDRQNVELQLYELKKQVDMVFFNILIINKNEDILKTHREDVKARLKDVESAVQNGVSLPANADILRAELLKLDQKQQELDIARNTAYKVLSELTGQDIAEGTSLQTPDPEFSLDISGKSRLEYGLFNFQDQKLDAMKKLSGTRMMPKFAGFGQAGFGRPAFDMLNNDLKGYYIFGARLSWNFWNWNKTRNEKQIIDLNKEILNSNVQGFDQKLNIEMANKLSEVIKYQKLIEKDAAIVELHSKIVATYASELKHGVITATEYLTELTAETSAKLDMEMHKIQLLSAKCDYLASAGKL
jgi:outer membrane protein TolC